MPEIATYVYCLVQSARLPVLRAAPAGMPQGGPARALPIHRGIWAIVSDAPLEYFSGEQFQQEIQDIEAVSRHALAHAAMIEHFFQRLPVIPLKLFTLFSGDERVRHQLAGRAAHLKALFSRLRGLEEWGVRITASFSPAPAHRPRRSAGAVTGRRYLEAKSKRREERAAPSPAARREVAAALRALGSLAARSRRDTTTGASFLVKTSRRASWNRRVAQLSASLEEHGHRLDVSGPWPPYHFTSGPGRAGRK